MEQMTFLPRERVHGVNCTRRCWFAKSEKCRCSCGGLNHGGGGTAANRRDHVDTSSERFKDRIVGLVGSRRVFIEGEELLPDESLKIRSHSPDGFAWGYGGSGPSQLALALLLRYTHPSIAEKLYQRFKFDMIACLPQDEDFEWPRFAVLEWLTQNGADEM